MAQTGFTKQEIKDLNETYNKMFGSFPPTAELGGGKTAYERIEKAIKDNKPIKIEYPMDRVY